MTGALEPGRFTALSRVLHWLTAVLVFCALFIGFVMVNSVGDYSALIMIHRTLGVTILAVVLVRLVNRLTHRAPPLPPTVGALERKIVVLSELSLYALLLLQPLIGWTMVSAAGGPIVVFGSFRLPRIAPFDAQLFWLLRQVHSVVAYALMAAIAAHVSAVLLHTLTLRDRMIERMTFRLAGKRRVH
ncbi:MAG TPA: cytochrome b/b6 domain-containing protein [Mycobacterium sp.]|uniref:cytochrome b n=1 Tax=Mycobacterium sp. TaxID=1785 RepID=UPI002D269DEE|nr:cytochrome b/b6 domain-containing protein [Mycobacterium sp.]HXY63862.1 cytochrome b/b6 domain-containing protein [Mycobacterium sp.]